MAGNFHEQYRAAGPEAPSDRSTGYVFAAASLVYALFHYRNGTVLMAGIALAAGFAVISRFVPSWLRPLTVAWFALGRLLHRIVSPVVMGVLFFGVILPFGAVMRIRHDPLQVKRDRARKSYWVGKPETAAALDAPLDSMKNQY